eukprot:TRINITY_DN11600_c0_g1_i1.p1 TRINITY_DN11600_c0_g1~~TRINITY_DN11600_c0_g1_i1.p1  ORF type:complete len:409 (+),score=195.81 TRINITY_DN11600_c0_g1_i1:104-1330(+)
MAAPAAEQEFQMGMLEVLYSNLRLMLRSDFEGEEADQKAATTTVANTLASVRRVLVGEATPAELRDEVRKGLLSVPAEKGGNDGTDPSGAAPANNVAANSVRQATNTPRSVMTMLVDTLRAQEFECRKDTEVVLIDLVVNAQDSVDQMTEAFLQQLCEAYEWGNYNAVALNSGNILRVALKHEVVLRRLLNHPRQGPHVPELFEGSLLKRFFRYVNVVDFEVASDAFWSFREALTLHQAVAADYLNVHFTAFFNQCNRLLQPQQNYVTRRQTLKIISELLMSRSNRAVMQRFTEQPQFLKTIMILLRDQSIHIKLEAFHVFKLFAANPKKTEQVKFILAMNRDKLLEFFRALTDPQALAAQQADLLDTNMREEIEAVVHQISVLEQVAKAAPRRGGYTAAPPDGHGGE